MPVKGIKQAKTKTSKMVGKITGQLSERTVSDILYIGMGHANLMTPKDTSYLVNSVFRRIDKTVSGVMGMAGYTANYASAVHAASGKLKGKPRTRKGATNNYWDPSGEPEFLRKGFEEDGKAEIMKAIKRGMKV